MLPLISIIIPTFNRVHLINETLDSIKNQNYKNWECIIIDDGSEDNTFEVVSNYIQNDKRFSYYLRSNEYKKGGNGARNYGFKISKGKYIKWFDSDDLMHEDLLFKQINFMEANNNYDFCACFAEVFYENGNRKPFNPKEIENREPLYNFILGDLFFLTPSPLWKKSFLESKNLFDENLYNAHESDFNFKRLVEGALFYYIRETLIYIRRGHDSLDNLSNLKPLSLISVFEYFQKIFEYLKQKNSLLSEKQLLILKKHVIKKQIFLTYNLKLIRLNNNVFEQLLIIFKNLSNVNIPLFDKIKIIFFTFIYYVYNKGYNFLKSSIS